MDYELLKNIVCRVECGKSNGTAFLINSQFALTAYHVLEDTSNIILFFEGKEEPCKAKYIDDADDHYKMKDIALLQLEDKTDVTSYIEFINRSLIPKEQWTSRGYPAVKGSEGNYFLGEDHIVQQQFDSLKNGKYDIELEHDKKLDSYGGVSGSPLIIDKRIAGIINSELLEKNTSKELNAISTKHFCELLKKYDISISDSAPPSVGKEDIAGAMLWETTLPSDKRNLSDKIKAVCSSISDRRIKKYDRDVTNGKIELEIHSDRTISAIKFRIFDTCQNELIRFVESHESSDMTPEEIDELVENFTSKAESIIQDKSKDYSYSGISNRDVLRKIVLNLIDECYLSFDEDGIYEE